MTKGKNRSLRIGQTVFVFLTRNQITCIDEEDWDKIRSFRWLAWKAKSGSYYAKRKDYSKGRRFPVQIQLSRFLNNTPTDLWCDHRNGDTLDNRKENLRSCTPSQNNRNSRKKSNNTSGYKGVHFCVGNNSFMSRIWDNRIPKKLHLGYFSNRIEAAKAYDQKALELFGEFALTNFSKREYSN